VVAKRGLNKVRADTRLEQRASRHASGDEVQRSPQHLAIRGLADNVSQARDLASALRRVLAAIARPWDRYASDSYTLLAYLRRDWGHRAESEAEVAGIAGAIREQIRCNATERRTAVVLGAGFGRIAHELLSDFDEVVALDSSILIVTLYALLRDAPLAVYEVNVANVRDHTGNAVRTDVQFDEPRGEVRFAVADVSAAPIEDGSVDVIVSAFFSDVVPLSRYVGEVRRMLRTGGIFVHFGPLGYHFTEREEQYSADEFMVALAAHGFQTHPPEWVGSTLLKSAGRLDEARFDSLCFTPRESTHEDLPTVLIPHHCVRLIAQAEAHAVRGRCRAARRSAMNGLNLQVDPLACDCG